MKLADMKMYEAKGRGKNLMIGEAYDQTRLEEGQFMDTIVEAQKEEIDPLTGLSNMMYFRNKARILIDTLDESRQIDFIYFNLSNFKKYNEEYGFHEGDAFLKAVADILRMEFPHRLICHLSDDHFAVMTYDESLEEKLHAVYEKVLDYSKRPMMIRAGICEYGNGMDDVSTIIDRARLACDNIRDRYDVFFRYYDRGLELKPLLRSGALDEEIRERILAAVREKPSEHHFREKAADGGLTDGAEEQRKMVQIGG